MVIVIPLREWTSGHGLFVLYIFCLGFMIEGGI